MRFIEGSYALDALARTYLSLLIAAAVSTWLSAAARPAPPGSRRRVASCALAAAALLAAPAFVLDWTREAIAITPVVGIFSLAAFKVLAFSVGRGPLQQSRLPTFSKFAAAACLPVIPRDVFKLSGGASAPPGPPAPASAFLRSYAAKIACALITVALTYTPYLPALAVHWLFALTLSLSVGGIWDAYCALAAGVFGLDVARSFDAPWLSTSFSDYWSRRWNLTTTYMLRVLIYEPVMEGCLVPKHLQAGAARPGPSEGEAGRDMTDGAEPLAAAPAAAPAGDDAAGSASEPQSPCLQSPPRVRRSGTPSGLSDDTSWGRVGGSDADAPLSSDAEPDAAGAAPAATPSPAASAALTGAAAAEEAAAGPVASEEDTDGTAAAAGTAGGLRRRRGAEAASGGAGRGATAAAADEAAPGAGPAASRAPAARRARLLRRAAALQATFLFSGLWHMMIWQHHHVGGAGWRWLAFFSLQAPIIMAETALQALWLRRWKLPPLPRAASVLLTNFLLIVVANPLFFGPCDTSGMCSRMMGSAMAVVTSGLAAARGGLLQFWAGLAGRI